MASIEQIIEDAKALPIKERAHVIDSLLRSMNPPDPETDREWAEVAQKRLAELRSGKVRGVPADEVFERARQKYGHER